MKLIKKFRQLVESSKEVSIDIYSFVDKSLSGIVFPSTKKQMLDLLPLLVSYTDKTNYAWLQISRLLSIPGFTDKLKDKNGNLKEEYTFDGLHVNALAYEIIAEHVIPLLK
jgi:hypothetical protein